jgi:hypothetical protein
MKKTLLALSFFLFMLPTSVFSQISYDAALDSADYTLNEYPIIPLIQADSIGLLSRVANVGDSALNGVSVDVAGPNSYSSSINLGNIGIGDSATGTTPALFMPNSTGTQVFYFETKTQQTDGNANNNKDTFSYEVTDTVMAREVGNNPDGLGYNGATGYVGQRFTLKTTDTITSITFYIDEPTAGDSLKAHVFSYSGSPGTILASSKSLAMASGQNWYTAKLECPLVATPGDYFPAVEQMTTNFMALGFTREYHLDSTIYYYNGAAWVPIEAVATLADATLMVRLNFGTPPPPPTIEITSTKDTVCPRELAFVSATAGAKSYKWYPQNAAYSPNSASTLIDLTRSTNVIVEADFGCGSPISDTFFIYVKPSVTGSISNDTIICPGDSATLSASTNGTYTWINGPTDSDWLVSPKEDTEYSVRFENTGECPSFDQVWVRLSNPTVEAFGDTAVCAGQPVSVGARDAETYQWENGPATANWQLSVDSTSKLLVTGFNDLGCQAIDSVTVTVFNTPDLTPMSDTGACFTRFITLNAGGTAENYEWSTGSDSSSTVFQVLQARTVTLRAYNANGCEAFDTVFVDRYIPPRGSTDEDTSVCFGEVVNISAYGGDMYVWSTGDTAQTIGVSPTERTRYSVRVISSQGCEDSEEMFVDVNPLAIPIFSTEVYEDSVVVTNQSQLSDSYLWDFGDGTTSTETDTYHVYDSSGDYTITLTATNNCGDQDTSEIVKVTVEVKDTNTGSISTLATKASFSAYPVPTSGVITYQINGPLTGNFALEILDFNGQLLRTEEYYKSNDNKEGNIDLTAYADGIYNIRFVFDDGIKTLRVVKQSY